MVNGLLQKIGVVKILITGINGLIGNEIASFFSHRDMMLLVLGGLRITP